LSKILCGLPTIIKILSSISVKTTRPAQTTSSVKNRWIGAYSFGITISGKLGGPNIKKKKKKKKILEEKYGIADLRFHMLM
jgi:hypothetical protein